MRPVSLLCLSCLVVAASLLGACNQDSYASNPSERETHMGDIRAASPPASAPAASAGAPAK